MWEARPSKLPYQCIGMKSTGQPAGSRARHEVLKSCSQVMPDGEPVTAGKPTLIPCSPRRGLMLRSQVFAAASAWRLEPPVEAEPSGSL